MICPNCNSENVYIQQEWEEYSYWYSECQDCYYQFSPYE